MKVQDVKDSFYSGLRNAIALANPARTVVLRGVTRPGVLVVENEFPVSDGGPVEAFQLIWSGLKRTADGLLAVTCEISYTVNGSTGATETASSTLGRGRALGAMDAELVSALSGSTRSFAGSSFAESAGVVVQSASGTQVFWGDITFGPVVISGDRVGRSAAVEVFGYGQ